MREYLKKFFKEYEYEAADQAELFRCYDQILMDADACKEWQDMMEEYAQNYKCDYKAFWACANQIAARLSLAEYTLQLLLMICLSRSLWDHYEKAGIDQSICRDTLWDLKYKNEECKLVKGIVGTFVVEWFYHAFTLNLFAFGRLQFEKTKLRFDFEGFKKGQPALGVHIPRSLKPLSPALCQDSYQRAAEFFRKELGEEIIFTCGSWLLNPENDQILPPKSNIRSFMSQFKIMSVTIDIHKDNLWRIFDTDEKNPARLPADSGLRRAFIAHLQKGGKIQTAYGAFIYR